MNPEALGPWFHNFHLPNGQQTAPNHFLGDFPTRKWQMIEAHIPEDLSGWRCLDIGCNAGFYSFELAKRGAEVLGIDSDPIYLRQANWLRENYFTENAPTFKEMQIHDLAYWKEPFDLVLFMGVFYHLRYPSLALDTISRLVNRLMVFQTLTSDDVTEDGDETLTEFLPEPNYPITERNIFQEPGWPKLSFVEEKYSDDQTNWFVPNHAAVKAMLRSTGFDRIERVSHEVYFCYAPIGGVEMNRAWPTGEWSSATRQVLGKRDLQ